MIPDAMAKISEINSRTGKFTLAAGKTQTLYIKVKSLPTTSSGWYSGQFNLKNSSGQVVKTATVYAYVWNVIIPESTHLQTATQLDYISLASETVYKNYYDFLLDNRICAFTVPGTLNASNEYLSNPRVNAINVAKNHTYKSQVTWSEARDIYNDISSRSDWDQIKDKFYFYTVDEPRCQQVHDTIQNEYFYGMHPPVDDVFQKNASMKRGWTDAQCLVVIDDNSPYPPGYARNTAWNGSKYLNADDGSGRFSAYIDTTQAMMNDGSTDIWVMKTQAFTPRSVLNSVGYRGFYREKKVMYIDGLESGFDYGNIAGGNYFNWDSKFGSFATRFKNYQTEKAVQGKNYKLWVYECGKGPDYTYCNLLIENTGLQSELLFWQTMQVGATGFLYYGANIWNEDGSDSRIAVGSSAACDGSTVSGKWPVNKWHPSYIYDSVNYPFGETSSQGTYGYGNGTFLYGRDVRTYLGLGSSSQPLGTVRVEHIRDGIEDYEMLYKYKNLYGESAMNTLIKKVSTDVTCYLSMPAFNRSAYSSSMTNEDIFASVRIELGNAVEARETHEHTWNDGVVTKSPTCSAAGTKKFTCTVCGDTKTETIAKLPHTWNEGVVTTPATYTTEGFKTCTCTVCGQTGEVSIGILPVKIGDVDGDGNVGIKDISSIKAYIAGVLSATDIIITNSDIDEDGVINMMDISAIKVLIAG